jgi:ribosome biogenesis GTPase A
MSGVLEEKPVILVANKTDLVRKRVIKTPGTHTLRKTTILGKFGNFNK